MTKVSSTEVQGMVGPELAVTGGAANGLGIHYDIVGDTDVSSPTAGVEIKLNEKSLQNAEKQTGVTRTPKPGPQAMSSSSPAAKRQEQGDNKYASLFNKRGLSHTVGFGPRPDYRSTLSPSAASPLARVQKRQLQKLRKMFDEVAARKTKKVAINAESLPQETHKQMVMDAITRGDQMTPIGSLDQAMKKAGMQSKGLRQAYNRWAQALFPGSYEDMPTPTKIN
jgi:hypothetical protein